MVRALASLRLNRVKGLIRVPDWMIRSGFADQFFHIALAGGVELVKLGQQVVARRYHAGDERAFAVAHAGQHQPVDLAGAAEQPGETPAHIADANNQNRRAHDLPPAKFGGL